ncbi:MAG: Glu-tRNA(Gln) amidotransferase subunit GatD [Candidatus Diapherotrites archaeon]|nr:Glu-tRNA(Gln) amidotransferase subunit GatD [Candidatus Diapherotrites archaeon]
MKLKTGERVKIVKNGTNYEGTVLPTSQYESKSYLVLKLDNGYNIGIKVDGKTKITKLKGTETVGKYEADVETSHMKDKPTVALISTGGTIASRIDYRTGGVVPQFTAKDLILNIPELRSLANIETEVLYEKWSEDLGPEDWQNIAKAMEKWANKGVDGIILAQGTDTIGYTSAALSFMLQDIGIPVMIVGSQRSSDRPSSDAAMNLLCAIHFATTANTAGVFACMHEKMDDDYCAIHKGTRVRKMHSSRRDAFKSINTKPVALVKIKTQGRKILKKEIDWIQEPSKPRNSDQKLKANIKIEKKTGLLKVFPGLTVKDFRTFAKGKKGIVVEGTGFGNVSKELVPELKKAVDDGVTVVMTTQTINGRVNLNVYDRGRDELATGLIPGKDLFPETAFVKLMWVLGQETKPSKIKKLMNTNLVGEINERIEPDTF